MAFSRDIPGFKMDKWGHVAPKTKTKFSKLLEELGLKDNYFSVRGELVFVNTKKKEIVIKVCKAIKSKNLKNIACGALYFSTI